MLNPKNINIKYALGEILIVIIGVSIAFSLNNWAESNRNAKDELLYLKNLKLDLEHDIAQLDSNKVEIAKRMRDIDIIMPFLGTDKPRRDTIFRKIFNLAELLDFTSEDATYQALINSGDMKLIQDFQLRSKIAAHYGSYTSLQKDYDRQDYFNMEYVGPFFMNHINYTELYKRDFSFMDHPQLVNILISLRGIYGKKYNSANKMMERCKELVKELELVIEEKSN